MIGELIMEMMEVMALLELNGANLQATAGTYSFVLDFSDPANPTYTIN